MPQALWHWNRTRAITDGVRRLSDLPEEEAAAALRVCCASPRWVARMLSQRPFKNADEVYDAGERIWLDIGPDEQRLALAAEPPPLLPDDGAAAVDRQRAVIHTRLAALLAIGSA